VLVFATGISACGDGVLQTSEVERSLGDAGYPSPRIARFADFDRRLGGLGNPRTGGLGNLMRLFDSGFVTDVVSVTPTGGTDDVFVVAQVYVNPDSGAGVPLGDSRPTVATAEGRVVADIANTDVLPDGFALRRVRTASLCNARMTAYQATPHADRRFDRAVGYLTARC
jgi:hypothetical protein